MPTKTTARPTKTTKATRKKPPAPRTKDAKSIQAESKRSGRSYIASLNDETRKHAYNHGIGWSDDDVGTLLNLIDKDETTYTMALALGRTFYSAQVARSHVAFASRHAAAFKRYL